MGKNKLKLRSLGIGLLAIVVFYLSLWGSAVAARALGLENAFLLVDAATVVFAVFVAAATAIVALKLVFRNTLGRDFGDEFDFGWRGFSAVERTRWMIGAFLVVFLGGVVASRADEPVMAGPLVVSTEAVDHILEFEVGGKGYYIRNYQRPMVPAPKTTASGCTIGFGYDVGHTSRASIERDWRGVLSGEEMRLVLSVQGKKGMTAYYATKRIRDRVLVTWEEAAEVFRRSSLRDFGELTARTYELEPGQLHPTQNGLMVSMTFNRGARLEEWRGPSDWDRYMEKRWIKHNLASGHPERVPSNFRHMTRLWRGRVAGLVRRYYAAATLWETTVKG